MQHSMLSLTLVLCACSVGTNYTKPGVSRPGQFRSPPSAATVASVPVDWWNLYADPQLAQLIAGANAENQTLKQALARVDEARQLTKVAAGAYFPSLALSPSVGLQRLSADRPNQLTGGAAGHGATVSDFLLPRQLSYEADVWGRVRRSVEASDAQTAAALDDAAMVRLAVQTDVAQYYYTLRLLDAQLEILTRTLTSYREQVRLLGVQVRTGIASAVALTQAEAQLHSTLSQREEVERARADEEHALAIVCGHAASSFAVSVEPLHNAAPPVVPTGLPGELLTRRPDVAMAEQNVIAANAQVGVATAEMYPHLDLSGTAGVESTGLAALFSWQSRLASLVAGISAPIFEGGRLSANVRAARARHRQAIAAYINQVLVAYGDVEDAITDLHAYTQQVSDLDAAVQASEHYRQLAGSQYDNGLVDYLIVIDAERTLLSNQLALAQASHAQMSASLHLIKALGGGWRAA